MKKLVSQVCRHKELNSDDFRFWINKLKLPWHSHRKWWEQAYISQALFERDCLSHNKKGLGFAVGKERLGDLFCSYNCKITATDLDISDIRSQKWDATSQLATGVDSLYHGISSRSVFDRNLSFTPVDMNNIPSCLNNYDFTWSTCSFEHCGSLDLGINFILNQMKCLKPGGVSVHTTEFNLISNTGTIEKGNTVIYRLKDMQKMVRLLEDKGYYVEPLDTYLGNHPLDQFMAHTHSVDNHLRLFIGGYMCTSIGIIITKPNK